jgi:hypothetical protein
MLQKARRADFNNRNGTQGAMSSVNTSAITPELDAAMEDEVRPKPGEDKGKEKKTRTDSEEEEPTPSHPRKRVNNKDRSTPGPKPSCSTSRPDLHTSKARAGNWKNINLHRRKESGRSRNVLFAQVILLLGHLWSLLIKCRN